MELDRITTIEQLEAHYEQPLPRSLVKEIDHISDHYRVFIEKSPFMVLATSGPEGLDCSPRGDLPGFVRVQDKKTVLLPDRRGNNRTDALHNIVHDPRVSLLFLIPGVGETLRVNGSAEIVVDQKLCESFATDGKTTRSVLVITVDKVYFHCPKAFVRSKLWSAEAQVDRSELPSVGEIFEGFYGCEFSGAEFDQSYPELLKKTLN